MAASTSVVIISPDTVIENLRKFPNGVSALILAQAMVGPTGKAKMVNSVLYSLKSQGKASSQGTSPPIWTAGGTTAGLRQPSKKFIISVLKAVSVEGHTYDEILDTVKPRKTTEKYLKAALTAHISEGSVAEDTTAEGVVKYTATPAGHAKLVERQNIQDRALEYVKEQTLKGEKASIKSIVAHVAGDNPQDQKRIKSIINSGLYSLYHEGVTSYVNEPGLGRCWTTK